MNFREYINEGVIDTLKRKIFQTLDKFTIYELSDGTFVQMDSKGGSLFGGVKFNGFVHSTDWNLDSKKNKIIKKLTNKEALKLVNSKFFKVYLVG